MPFNSKKIEKIVRGMGVNAKQFFSYCYPDRSGKTNASFNDIGNNDNPKADVVERIADFLQCPIDELYDRTTYLNGNNNVNGDNNTVGNVNINTDPVVLTETNKQLREIIARQDKIIEELNKKIDKLIDLVQK